MMAESEKKITITQFGRDERASRRDVVAVEEPLEIRVVSGPNEKRRGKSLSITMRTPGNDFELAVGFLFTEGIVENETQIKHIEFCGPVAVGREDPNIVRVELTPETPFDIQNLQRHFYTTSSCGICGKASLEALDEQSFLPVESEWTLSREHVFKLPDLLRQSQTLFQRTGGIHAAGLFNVRGELLAIHEDVGRHNALDKLIGSQLLNSRLPASDQVLVVSGRASFELLQKALSAAIPIFIAVGAPSSLAVELAEKYNITLIGFSSDLRFNVYCHGFRVA